MLNNFLQEKTQRSVGKDTRIAPANAQLDDIATNTNQIRATTIRRRTESWACRRVVASCGKRNTLPKKAHGKKNRNLRQTTHRDHCRHSSRQCVVQLATVASSHNTTSKGPSTKTESSFRERDAACETEHMNFCQCKTRFRISSSNSNSNSNVKLQIHGIKSNSRSTTVGHFALDNRSQISTRNIHHSRLTQL
jgi:hypothetical protein